MLMTCSWRPKTQKDASKVQGLCYKPLGELGYRASAKKVQICQSEVTYLGYQVKDGQRWLTPARKETIAHLPVPKNPKQLREFLGTAGFSRLWIPGFAEIVAPLYALIKDKTSFVWTKEHQGAFDTIKWALLSAPALGLPDLTKPFELFIDQKRGFAKGVLTQRLGPWRRSTAYLSKKLDPVASGWPPCLRMVAAIAVLTKDAGKLTLWQPLTVLALHAVESIVRQPPDRWLSNARMTHYQSLLLDTDCVHFGPATSLNPATLLPEPDEAVLHNCYQILAETHGTQPDLTDQPQLGAELTWFTDGSSYLHQGERKAGAAVVDGTKVVDIMRVNVDKVLERDQKLSELDDRADALQAGASQFESSAAKLKRKYWWKNCKMMIMLGAICAIIVVVIVKCAIPPLFSIAIRAHVFFSLFALSTDSSIGLPPF
ncbi:hypothetical protein STEG23_028560 [Scotinomys teguina]